MMLQLIPRLLCICYIQRGLSFSHSLQPPRTHTISSNLNAVTNNNNGIVVEGGDNNDSDVLPEIPVLPALRSDDETTKFIPPIFNNSKEETNSNNKVYTTNLQQFKRRNKLD